MFLFLLASCVVPTAPETEFGTVGESAVNWAYRLVDWIEPSDNNYGSPASIDWYYDPARPADTIARAHVRCGAFVSEAFQWGGGVSEGDIHALTTQYHPDSAHWYDHIVAGANVGTLNLGAVGMGLLEKGDLLVAKHATPTETGHIMFVWSAVPLPVGQASVIPVSPADPTDTRWLVVVYDATSTPHGTLPSLAATAQGVVRDSRNAHPDIWGAEDSGVGVGTIVVYTDAESGEITGWKWSYNGSYYDQSEAGRPMVAGRLSDEG